MAYGKLGGVRLGGTSGGISAINDSQSAFIVADSLGASNGSQSTHIIGAGTRVEQAMWASVHGREFIESSGSCYIFGGTPAVSSSSEIGRAHV